MNTDHITAMRLGLDALENHSGNYKLTASECDKWQAAVDALTNAIAQAQAEAAEKHCMCEACKDGVIHDSDCSVHNEPAYPKGPCDCCAAEKQEPVAWIYTFDECQSALLPNEVEQETFKEYPERYTPLYLHPASDELARVKAERGGWERDAKGMQTRWNEACNDIGILQDRLTEAADTITTLRAQLAEAQKERNAFQDQCIGLKHKNVILSQERDSAIATIERMKDVGMEPCATVEIFDIAMRGEKLVYKMAPGPFQSLGVGTYQLFTDTQVAAMRGNDARKSAGEIAVLASLLKDATAVLRTIDPEDTSESELLVALIARCEKAFADVSAMEAGKK